jgi:hypothetical protein
LGKPSLIGCFGVPSARDGERSQPWSLVGGFNLKNHSAGVPVECIAEYEYVLDEL